MEAESYFHLITISTSWFFYNKFFIIMTEYGVIYAPFIVYLYSRWYDKLEDDNFNSIAVLSIKGLTVDIVVYLLLYGFAILPFININAEQLTYTNQNTGDNYKIEESIKMPMLWYGIDYITSSLTKSLKQTLPNNIEGIRGKIDAVKKINIKSQSVKIDISNFIRDCYSPALAKYQKMSIQGVPIKQIDWFGSEYFLKTEGFYKSCTANSSSPACGHIKPDGTTVNGNVDYPQGITTQNKSIDATNAVSCKAIWLGGVNLTNTANAKGLRKKIAKDLNVSTSQWIFTIGTRGYSLDRKIRDVLFVSEWQLMGLTGNADNKEDRDLGFIDSTVYAFKSFGTWQKSASLAYELEWATDFIKQYLPVTQALLLALVVIITPIVLLLGAVNLNMVIGLFLFYFTIRFLTVIWAVVAWLDDKLLYIIYGSAGNSAYETVISAASSFTTSGNVIVIGIMTLYILAPIIWFKLMSMAGGKAMSGAIDAGSSLSGQGGSATSLSGGGNGIQKGITSQIGKVRSKAGGIAKGVATKGVSKFKSGW